MRMIAAVAWGLIAVTASACGGGGDSQSARPERLPAEQFELRLSEVCATYEKEWNAWAAQLSDQSIDAGRASRQAYEIARRMADDLATIEPEGRVEAWRRAIKSLDEGLDAVGRENPPNIRHPEIRIARNALVDDFGADGCFA